MKNDIQDYSLFIKFIETFSPAGFKEIDPNDSLILELEKMTENKDQFYYVADLIKLKILFTSKRSFQMIGIEPDELTPHHIMEATHPVDLLRYNLAKAKCQRLFPVRLSINNVKNLSEIKI